MVFACGEDPKMSAAAGDEFVEMAPSILVSFAMMEILFLVIIAHQIVRRLLVRAVMVASSSQLRFAIAVEHVVRSTAQIIVRPLPEFAGMA